MGIARLATPHHAPHARPPPTRDTPRSVYDGMHEPTRPACLIEVADEPEYGGGRNGRSLRVSRPVWVARIVANTHTHKRAPMRAPDECLTAYPSLVLLSRTAEHAYLVPLYM